MHPLLQVLSVGVEGEVGRAVLEEVEVLARVHREQHIHPTETVEHGVDRLRRQESIDLIPQGAAAVAKDHPELGDRADLRTGRVQLEAVADDLAHRMHRMDPLEAQLTEPMHDQRVGRTDRIAVARKLVQGPDIEVVRMTMRDHQQIDVRKRLEVHRAGRTRHDRAVLERIEEHRVHQTCRGPHLHQDRRMTEQRHPHTLHCPPDRRIREAGLSRIDSGRAVR